MGLGQLIGKLFGGGAGATVAESSEPVEYNGFAVIAAPIKDNGQFKTAGSISKQIDGELKTARFIRADNHADHGSAVSHSQNKARQIIDEQGESMFERDHI